MNPALMMLMRGGGAHAALVASFTGSFVDDGNRTTYTFSAVPLGTVADERRIVVAVTARRSVVLSSVAYATIGGVAATVHAETSNTLGVMSALLSAVVPTGATGDVSVTLNGAALRLGIGVWSIGGSSVHVAATDRKTLGPATVDLSIPAGGVAFATAGSVSTDDTCSWAGVTERYDELVESGAYFHSGGDVASATAQTVTITPTWSNPIESEEFQTLAAVSFLPG